MTCALPGCANPVPEVGDTCADCVAAFGTWLRPAATRLTADDIRARDEYVERAYQQRRSKR